MAEPQTSLSQANHALVEHAHAADEARAVILKAHVVGSGDVQPSAAIQAVEATERTFGELGALPPPFDPDALCVLFENSSALRPNVDAYCANIDAHGHRFEPVLDFDAEDAVDRVAAAVYAERLWLQEHGKLAEGEAVQPTKEEAAALLKTLDAQARMEKIRLDNWSEFCCADTSLVAVRRQTRMDLETLGNAYWEILRNVAGELALIVHVPGFTVRLLPLDPTPVPVEMRVKVSPISYQTIQITRCFRRYVQVVEGMPPVYFKELGDPRVVSRKTGKVFESIEAMQREDEADQPATEILHFKVHSPRSAYGVPRWMGTLLEVLGSRQAAEVNFFYFQNKSVPPLALLVSGGRLSQSSVPRIERFIEEHVKGKKNFHKILIIEAESTRTASNERAGRISLEFHPLTSAQQTDALFQHYDERNIDKIGAAFRLPRLLRGDIRDFNRSCYSEDTETLTEHGWKRVDDIAEGERIAVYDQKRGCIEYVVPAAKLVYEVDEELLHFRNAHVDVLVTGNHRMLVRPCNTKRPSWKICRADEIQYSRFQFRVTAEPDTRKSEAPESITLPRCCQIQRGHNHAPIAMSDWLEFLGYFVSEGGLVLTDHPAAPYLVYKMEAGTSIPPSAAANDRAALRQPRNSPRTSSRLSPRATTKKKSVIKPSLIQCRNERLKSNEPNRKPNGVSQKLKNGVDHAEFDRIKAAQVAGEQPDASRSLDLENRPSGLVNRSAISGGSAAVS